MSVSDPIADMLTRIRNALMVGKNSVNVPVSKIKLDIAKILDEEGFVDGFELWYLHIYIYYTILIGLYWQ